MYYKIALKALSFRCRTDKSFECKYFILYKHVLIVQNNQFHFDFS